MCAAWPSCDRSHYPVSGSGDALALHPACPALRPHPLYTLFFLLLYFQHLTAGLAEQLDGRQYEGVDLGSDDFRCALRREPLGVVVRQRRGRCVVGGQMCTIEVSATFQGSRAVLHSNAALWRARALWSPSMWSQCCKQPPKAILCLLRRPSSRPGITPCLCRRGRRVALWDEPSGSWAGLEP